MLSHVWLFEAPWTVVRQALSIECFSQEYWNGLPFPTPGDLPDSGMETVSLESPELASEFFTINATLEVPFFFFLASMSLFFLTSMSYDSTVCEPSTSRCSAGLWKGRRSRDQIAICWIIEKAREFQKNICLFFIDYAKAFECVDHNKLWKILQEMGIPDHFICPLRNLYLVQEATIRTGHGKMDWFHIGTVVCQGRILSPCLVNFYAQYIIWNTRMEEAQARNKISRRNINNYVDDTTLWRR